MREPDQSVCFGSGDVIGSYGGKKIEICNTDAEGRLILADAMAYMVKDEQADRVVDIATLTGAVVGMLGFSTAGLLSDDDAFCDTFKSGKSQRRTVLETSNL